MKSEPCIVCRILIDNKIEFQTSAPISNNYLPDKKYKINVCDYHSQNEIENALPVYYNEIIYLGSKWEGIQKEVDHSRIDFTYRNLSSLEELNEADIGRCLISPNGHFTRCINKFDHPFIKTDSGYGENNEVFVLVTLCTVTGKDDLDIIRFPVPGHQAIPNELYLTKNGYSITIEEVITSNYKNNDLTEQLEKNLIGAEMRYYYPICKTQNGEEFSIKNAGMISENKRTLWDSPIISGYITGAGPDKEGTFISTQLLREHIKNEFDNSYFGQNIDGGELEKAKFLFQKALSERKYTIPDLAIIRLPDNNLQKAILKEYSNSIIVHFFDNSGKNIRFSFCKLCSDGWWNNFIPEISTRDFLYTLGAGIIHDFLVSQTVEYQRISRKKLKGIIRKETSKHNRANTIYLPRKQSISDLTKRYLSIGRHLSAHQVRGHLRKLCEGYNPSKLAQDYALRFNIELPANYTFVRPHKRGIGEVILPIYKSELADQMFKKS